MMQFASFRAPLVLMGEPTLPPGLCVLHPARNVLELRVYKSNIIEKQNALQIYMIIEPVAIGIFAHFWSRVRQLEIFLSIKIVY